MIKHSGSQIWSIDAFKPALVLESLVRLVVLTRGNFCYTLSSNQTLSTVLSVPFVNDEKMNQAVCAFLYCKCLKSLLEQELGNEARAFTELFSPVRVCLIECDYMSYVPILILPKVHVYTSCGLPVEELLVQLVQQKVDNIWSDFDVAVCTDIVGHVHGKFPGYWHMVLKE